MSPDKTEVNVEMLRTPGLAAPAYPPKRLTPFFNWKEIDMSRDAINQLLGDIEKGRRDNYDPMTLAALEQALRWETGSVRRILDGGEPTDLATPTARVHETMHTHHRRCRHTASAPLENVDRRHEERHFGRWESRPNE